MSTKTLGILGSGQLGRMSAQAAKALGIRTIIFTPEEGSPASQIADETIVAAYKDERALKILAKKCDTITYEFENIPLETVRYLQTLKPVYPDDQLLGIAQDRIAEKSFLSSINIPTTKWAEIHSASDIENAFEQWNIDELIIKTTRFGYDGKGQARLSRSDDLEAALDQFTPHTLIAEHIIDFECEISVIVARDQFGTTQTYGPVLNEHKNHILHKTTFPAPIAPELAERALKMTTQLAEKLSLIGVLALELFITKDGQILANEIAPRTHNSGHWTIDACAVSQFENHVRATCGLPVLPPGQHSTGEMINLIGGDINDLSAYETNEHAHIHLYGKTEAKAGRKMGHVTLLK